MARFSKWDKKPPVRVYVNGLVPGTLYLTKGPDGGILASSPLTPHQ